MNLGLSVVYRQNMLDGGLITRVQYSVHISYHSFILASWIWERYFGEHANVTVLSYYTCLSSHSNMKLSRKLGFVKRVNESSMKMLQYCKHCAKIIFVLKPWYFYVLLIIKTNFESVCNFYRY